MSSGGDDNEENENDSDASADEPVPTVNYGPWSTVMDPYTSGVATLKHYKHVLIIFFWISI